MSTFDADYDRLRLTPAPPISGIYVHVGNGERFHVAASASAGRTECGIPLERSATRGDAIPPDKTYLVYVCRRCAGRYLPLAQALLLVR